MGSAHLVVCNPTYDTGVVRDILSEGPVVDTLHLAADDELERAIRHIDACPPDHLYCSKFLGSGVTV